MSGNNLLLDTNIILYYLSGDKKLIPLIEDNSLVISIITEIELMGYNRFNKKDLDSVQQFISYCSVKDLDEKIKNEAIRLRRNSTLKLPDAVILATSIVFDMPFMTADKDFKVIDEGKIIFYEM